MSRPKPINPKLPKLWHGGDYNPDQWPEQAREEDVRLMKLAGVNLASTAIFSWAQIEPAEGEYDWAWLDETMDRLYGAGVHVALATPSAAPPRWLTEKHPEILAVNAQGQRYPHTGRVIFCPTVNAYREQVERINRALAERYGKNPAVVLWHVSNEYNTRGWKKCYCEHCRSAWRDWLEKRYGDIQTLNQQWWTAFWSQTYFSLDQVIPPVDVQGTLWPINGLELDWRRFTSHQMADFFKHEARILRELTPEIPITTNLMGLYEGMDYRELADLMDVISWDSYPDPVTDQSRTAFTHALMRGLKDNQPWLLMETTPSSTNWKEFHQLKAPGQHRLQCWQAIGHGSDSAMYFQWRRGRGGHEKFHGAVVAHVGHEHTRVFAEVAQLGKEMDEVSDAVVGTRPTRARIGILWDQQSRWALKLSCGPGREKGIEEQAVRHFKAIWGQNIPVDVVRMDGDWSQYNVLVAPMLYMVKTGQFPREASPEELHGRLDEAAKLTDWVSQGGVLVATYLTGYVNENDLIFEGGYPGPLRELLGVWVEELDNQPTGEATNTMILEPDAIKAGTKDRYTCDDYFELLHAESAEVLGHYGGNWYAGRPCLTRNYFGNGRAYYIATNAEDAFLQDFYRILCHRQGIEPVVDAAGGVEVLVRECEEHCLLFVLNHTHEERAIHLGDVSGTDLLSDRECRARLKLEPYGVRIIQYR